MQNQLMTFMWSFLLYRFDYHQSFTSLTNLLFEWNIFLIWQSKQFVWSWLVKMNFSSTIVDLQKSLIICVESVRKNHSFDVERKTITTAKMVDICTSIEIRIVENRPPNICSQNFIFKVLLFFLNYIFSRMSILYYSQRVYIHYFMK